MRFWGVTALRYIKSEKITPVELMTANKWGSQPAHSAKRRPTKARANHEASTAYVVVSTNYVKRLANRIQALNLDDFMSLK